MSYILDALKRADAERSRGAVPGLHARQLPSADNAAPLLLQNRVWLPIVAAGLLGAVGLWAWRTPSPAPGLPMQAPLAAVPVNPPTPTPSAPTASAQPVTAPATQTPVPPVPLAATPNAQMASTNAVLTAPPGTSAATHTGQTTHAAVALNDTPGDISNAAKAAKAGTTTPATAPSLASTPALKATQTPAPAAVAAPTATATAATPPDAASAAPPATPAAAPLLGELPDALRSQLPKLAITGTVYAEDPKQRLLLVNNQVLPQGSVLAPDLTLEEIRPRHSVFNFRGTRFRVAH